MVTRRRSLAGLLVGAGVGYLAWAIASNLENWQFYTIRRWVTGKSAMSEIVEHPADLWIGLFLLALFILLGAISGLAVARLWHSPKQL
jgi:hypothetical protein